MKILDHEPQSWFLAEENGPLFFDANCDHGGVGYSYMIELSPLEVAECHKKSRAYLSALANSIHNSVPIRAASSSIYKGRDVSGLYSKKLLSANAEWRNTIAKN